MLVQMWLQLVGLSHLVRPLFAWYLGMVVGPLPLLAQLLAVTGCVGAAATAGTLC